MHWMHIIYITGKTNLNLQIFKMMVVSVFIYTFTYLLIYLFAGPRFLCVICNSHGPCSLKRLGGGGGGGGGRG